MANPRVHKQGSLDGLCGLYSIANAFTRLVQNLNPEEVFSQAALGLPRRVFPDVLWDGLDIDDLVRSARHVARWVEKTEEVRIRVSLPFKHRRFQKTADFLDELASLMANKRAWLSCRLIGGRQRAAGVIG